MRRQYIGFEPSGRLHIGVLPIFEALKKDYEEGWLTTLFVANWHAEINGKAIYPEFEAELKRLADLYLTDYEGVTASKDYLKDIADLELQVSSHLTTARFQKALTITGKEYKGSERLSVLRYVSLQVTDPFYLDVERIISGSDQRSCSVLSLEVAKKLDTPMDFRTHPLMLNTKATKLDDPKMSKSNPDACIFVFDSDMQQKISKATDFWVEHACELLGLEYVDYKQGRANLIGYLRDLHPEK